MRKKLSIALKIITSIPITLIALLAIVLAGSKIAGLQLFTVLSPSMEPNILTGALIGVKETDPEELGVGDVITFRLNESTTATHRIIELVPDEDDPDTILFRTKGDNNESPDNVLVEPSDVIGTPAYNIPYLGYLMSYVQSTGGIFAMISVGAFLLLLMTVSDFLADGDGDKKDKKKDKKNKNSDNEIKDPDEAGLELCSEQNPEQSSEQIPEQSPEQSSEQIPEQNPEEDPENINNKDNY